MIDEFNKDIYIVDDESKLNCILRECNKNLSASQVKIIVFEGIKYSFDSNHSFNELFERLAIKNNGELEIQFALKFENCIFTQEKRKNAKNSQIFIKNIQFKSSLEFNKCEFDGALYFDNVSFHSNVVFENIKINNKHYSDNLISFINTKHVSIFPQFIFYPYTNKEPKEFYFPQEISFNNIEVNHEINLTDFFDIQAFSAYKNHKDLILPKVIFNNASFKELFEIKERLVPNPYDWVKLKLEFCNATFKKDIDFKNWNNYFDCRTIVQSTFNGKANFSNIVFDKEVNFSGTKFLELVTFSHSKFNENANFSSTIFKSEAYFNKAEFNKLIDFNSSIFEYIANFYYVTFKNIPNFSMCAFDKSSLANFIGVNIEYLDFYIMKKSIEIRIDNEKTPTESNIQNSQNYKDSFRSIKNMLISQNNIIEASKWHKLELYAYELELKYKTNLKEQYRQNLLKNTVEKFMLWFYRHTSEHHTNLSIIFTFTLSIIGVYFLLSEILNKNINYNIICYTPIAYIVSAIVINTSQCLFDKHFKCNFKQIKKIFLLIFTCFAFYAMYKNPKTITPLIGIISEDVSNANLSKCIDKLDKKTSILIAEHINTNDRITTELSAKNILQNSKYIIKQNSQYLDDKYQTNFGEYISSDKKSLYINIIYYIIMFLMLFSLQKTARKNSIVPN